MNKVKQLSRLSVFATVAQHASFTKAAEQLNLSKSAVSQQITLLESELEIRLLNRTTRGVSLTAVGSKLYTRCSILLEQVDLLFSDIEEEKNDPKGRFAVTFPHSLQSAIVLPAIEQLCTEYPNLQPELIADDATLDLVKHKLDVAIHVGELPDSSYRALPAGNLTEIFCATPAYLKHHPDTSTVEALSQHHWIANPWQQSLMKITDQSTEKTDKIRLNQFSKANTLPAAIEIALHHLGIILVPDILAKHYIQTGKLIHIAPHLKGPQWPIYTVHAYQNDKPKHLSRFHELIVSSLRRSG